VLIMRSNQSCGAATQLKDLTAYYLCVFLFTSSRQDIPLFRRRRMICIAPCRAKRWHGVRAANIVAASIEVG
ncbi:MAG: hypothetical protein K2F62_07165, partial [Muribaculaceae bacterium]|nr:hypothetical protein [Muribaculaceae bacterium]